MIVLPKDKYSEGVVRKALYWLSEQCGATLEEDDQSWRVTLEAEDCAFEFHRILNDFLLRAEHDVATKCMRLAIVRSALKHLADASDGR